ncbi:MAG: hypothetical protein B6242_13510 [Anaerolineaceae bacterium 4572_78]|nr:MAG: hypothetical protein B6242_13510 [Anaerolineaceae bacterium 4572_78]
MLTDLTIKNFAIIDELHLTFNHGFNVLTGETGAGKSIIVDAISLLLGARGNIEWIRAGTKSTQLEGLFYLSTNLQAQINPILIAEGLEGDSEEYLLLGREIRVGKRNFCRVNGRTVSLNLLQQLAEPLIDIHGQHQHLSLLHTKQHQAFLDRFGGIDNVRESMATEYRQLQTVNKELRHLQQNAQQIARRVDQLTYQINEIESADLEVGEDSKLATEQTRLSNIEKLNELISYLMDDLANQIQTYIEEIDFNPHRLQEVEERLSIIYLLKRKYGNTIPEILNFAERAKTELNNVNNAEERIEKLKMEKHNLRMKVGKLASNLSKKRQAIAKRLSQDVESELQMLGMEKTIFEVHIEQIPFSEGSTKPHFVNSVFVDDKTYKCDERGIDQIEFLIAPNPGEPPKAMNRIASGGETSRIMLALKTVLALADKTPTLIFDEIDQGIGGRMGMTVGYKLWNLTHQTYHQVLCVTHLPQIASFGDMHYHVSKHIEDRRTRTDVHSLHDESQIEELAQMIGTLSEATKLSATDLLRQADALKKNCLPPPP